MKTGKSINCYSDGEGAFMQWGQALRARLFGPLLCVLSHVGIRAGHITGLSLVSGLAFCPLYIYGQYPMAFVCLLAHVLLDGLDGPLARYVGRDGDRGSFTDTVSDQVVVTATTITTIFTGHIDVWPGAIYLSLYTVVVAFAMVRNAMQVPYSWLFRPRFVIFAVMAIDVFFSTAALESVFWIAAGLLMAKAFSGFIAIRKRLN